MVSVFVYHQRVLGWHFVMYISGMLLITIPHTTQLSRAITSICVLPAGLCVKSSGLYTIQSPTIVKCIHI